jgi:hypothetical protein
MILGKDVLRTIATCIAAAGSFESCSADQFATIEIYKASVKDVCGAKTYVESDGCPTIDGTTFDKLKAKGRFKILYQSNPIPPDSNSFSDDLIGDSRLVSDFVDGTSGLAALLVVRWVTRPPRSINITREDSDGNPLSKPFQSTLSPGRFFYHFPYEQLSRVVVTMKSRLPDHQIVYHP